MTSQRRATLILAGLLVLAVLVPTLVAHESGQTRELRRLEQRVERLETQVSLLVE